MAKKTLLPREHFIDRKALAMQGDNALGSVRLSVRLCAIFVQFILILAP